MAKIRAGEVIVRMLKEEGVEVVFGIIDGTYFGFYSALHKYGIRLITPRHETCAAHMAGAYARLTGRLGVCMASNGPGVANVLPGVAVENAEGNRVLLITSSRRTGITYPDRGGTYQYFDHCSVIRPMAKWSESAQLTERIQPLLRQALRMTRMGRPGVVHFDVPENLINGKIPVPGIWTEGTYGRTTPIHPPPAQVEAAARLLLGAQMPIIHAGSGAAHSGAFRELQALAELLHTPVVTSWGGRGVMAENHHLAVPMIYVKLNNEVRNSADVVLVLGSRIGETDWWGKPPYWRTPGAQKMIQVDTDEAILGANKPADVAVLADVGVFLQELLKYIKETGGAGAVADTRRRKADQLLQKKQKFRVDLDRHLLDQGTPIHSAHVGAVTRQMTADDAILVVDGGNTAIWANFYHEVRTPNTILSTPKMGMLGAGVSQALGAAAAFPQRQVLCIIGDGAMGFHPQEIETAVRNNLKPIFIVLCDRQWGMVKINQHFALKPLKTLVMKSLSPSESINTDLGEIAWDQMAESMGAHGERVNDIAGFKAAFQRCQQMDRCSVIHVDVDRVKHMWAPALMDFKNMHLEPAGA